MTNPVRSHFVTELLKLDNQAMRSALYAKKKEVEARLAQLTPDHPHHALLSAALTECDRILREASHQAFMGLYDAHESTLPSAQETVVSGLDQPVEEPKPASAPAATPARPPLRPNVPNPNMRKAQNGTRTDLSQDTGSHGVGADHGAPAQAGQEPAGNRNPDGDAGNHQAPARASEPAAPRPQAARPLPAQAVQAPAPQAAGQAQGTPKASGLSALKKTQQADQTPAEPAPREQPRPARQAPRGHAPDVRCYERHDGTYITPNTARQPDGKVMKRPPPAAPEDADIPW
ncbi:hypothetical protein [Microvirga yunnanensis]|uniref:hypothetical protein n=1 Tax=Microvirga yunnanensis TaxID=2953740 RepID=UPI0021C60532|nr:hypothetical protein [Microvirga sp. HBU67655]